MEKSEANRSTFLELLTIYGKHVMYGTIRIGEDDQTQETSPILQAYAIFHIAAELGSGEAYFFLAMMQYFGLDYFTDKDIDFEALKNPRIDLRDYLKKRKDILSNTYLYTSTLHGSENAMIAMGNKYTYGIGVKKDCITSLAYKKDPAHSLATSRIAIPAINGNYHLSKDIYSMNVNQGNSVALRKKNEDKIRLA